MSDQIQQLNTTEPQSLLKRLFSRMWFRFVGVLMLVALIALISYAVFGLVSGGSATLRLFPANGTYQSGQGFVVGITLESPSAPVVAVTAVIKYNTAKMGPVLSGVQAGSDWSASAKIVEKVTSDITGDPDYNQQLKITIGQPSPGIQDSVPLSIIDIPFRVVASTDPAFAGTAKIMIDGAQSIVVKDDAGGTDILGTVAPVVTYNVFPSPATQSCTTSHPGAQVCTPSTLYYCPSQYQYAPPRGGWTEGADCCQANRCETYPTLQITQGSESVDVAQQPNGQYAATFKWQTNIGIDLSSAESTSSSPTPLLGIGSGDGSSVNHTLVVQNLPAGRTYAVRIYVRRTIGGKQLSAQSVNTLTFTTGNQNTANSLKIFDLTVDSVTNNAARVSWTTNFLANRQISCTPSNPSIPPCSVIYDSSIYSTRHDARITRLAKNTTYSIVVTSTMQPGINPEVTQRSGNASTSFTTTNLAIQNDANLILKVDPDRQCGKWMTCVSSVSVKNRQNKAEEMCVALGVCDTIDPATGACLNLLGSAQGSSFHSAYDDPESSTVDLANNLSGVSKVSNSWSGYSSVGYADYEARGVEPISSLKEFGSSVSVPNGTFQLGAVYPWESYPFGSASLKLENDNEIGSSILNIISSTSTPQTYGAKVSLGSNTLSADKLYYASFRIKANIDQRSALGNTAKVRVQFIYRGNTNPTTGLANSSFELTVGPGWQQAVIGPFIPPANLSGPTPTDLGEVSIAIVAPASSSSLPPTAVMIDDVILNPILRGGPGLYIPRICRAYASNSSPACDYFDPFSGRLFRGWKGYCLMPDPKDSNVCLQWWPVDVVGSSPFAIDTPAGYLADGGKFPLYYCLEAAGNAPYVNSSNVHLVNNGNLSCPRNSSTSMVPFAGEGGCSGFKFFPGLKYPSQELAAIKVSWYFARDDNSCTLRNQEQVVWLSAANGFKNTGVINHNDSGSAVSTFSVERRENGQFAVGVCSSGNGSSGTVWKIDATYYMRETCNVIAQVVTPDGKNKAQTDRVKQPSNFETCARDPLSKECANNYTIPRLGYWYGSDFAPFGAVVHPNPDFNPGEWTSRLFVESAFDTSGQSIGQARAGQPYSISARSGGGYCRNNPAVTCYDDTSCVGLPTQPNICEYHHTDYTCGQTGTNAEEVYQCSLTGTTCSQVDSFSCATTVDQSICDTEVGTITGECILPDPYNAKSVCVAGSNIGKECQAHEDCGDVGDGTPGYCAGPEKPPFVDWTTYSKALISNPKNNLSNLFVETYGTWQWAGSSYVKICEEGSEPVCVGGTNAGMACGPTSGVTCTGGTCGYRRAQPDGTIVGTGQCGDDTTIKKEYGWSPLTSGVVGVAPTVTNIRVNSLPEEVKVCPTEFTCYTTPAALPSGSFQGVGQYPVTLTFNSNVNSNQLPLRRYSVDWGDGTVTSESDLQIKGKEGPNNLHTLGHLYQYKAGNPGCDKPTVGECKYQIRIQIEDNWGWCNGNTTTPECGLQRTNAWTLFSQLIIVKNR